MTAPALMVVAKAPVPGTVKTRLSPPLHPTSAAEIAAAALLDTLDNVLLAARLLAAPRPVLALAGDPRRAVRAHELQPAFTAFRVVRQRGGALGERLLNAQRDGVPSGPLVLVGMDTPQAGADALLDAASALGAAPAALGPAVDGGWWALALREARDMALVRDVEMSTPDTGEATRHALVDGGVTPRLLATYRDVDHWEDAVAVAAGSAGTRFAHAVAEAARTLPAPAGR
ncbi:TIGR04282 family arsenosugar biosynthesis glycosyltransferase [Motilibacter deserti]|uniref:DUF2064 domain-containing protein n=1 Tax=Motilibacter deserti TaxID=2714956 RepID=A0ABX0GNS5_9ACTN|nr:DUF2064 domain-containing protein [Motilibacter deserti]NHC12491.1 DUF2064 domain-containing protein [Motilibacter deserti]